MVRMLGLQKGAPSVIAPDPPLRRLLAWNLQNRKNKRYRQVIEDDIAHKKRVRGMIVNALGWRETAIDDSFNLRWQWPAIGAASFEH